MPEPEDARRGATGEYTVHGVPRGVTSITPYIGVPSVVEAMDFYRRVFDARIIEVTKVGGAVVHAQLDFGNGHLHLERPNPESGLAGPPPDGPASFSLGFYCEDVDARVARAQAAGAELLAPAVSFASGDRFAAVGDPYGVQWSIMSRVEDLSEAQSANRIAEWSNEDHGGN